MSQNKPVFLSNGKRHTIGNTTFIVNSYASAENSKTAAELIMDMLLSIVKSKEEFV